MFGLFDPKPTCDWCGVEFDGDGLRDGELRLCSPGCLALKNAPPAEPSPAVDRGPPPMTLGRARSDLGIASAEFEQYGRRSMQLDRETNCEAEFMETQQSYFVVWETLDRIRDWVALDGCSVATYDDLRADSIASPDRYDIVTHTREVNGHTQSQNIGTARFEPGNEQRLAAAIEAMRLAVDEVARG